MVSADLDNTTKNSGAKDEGAQAQFVTVANGMITPAGSRSGTPRVVIVGGGFAGINVAKSLAKSPVSVTLIDRRNHHLFAPLLFQVATAQLSPANIAQPIRAMTKGQKNLKVVLGEVETIDSENRTIGLENGTSIPYDYLVVAVGATHSYFGHDEWEPVAPGLKTLEDAERIRRRILLAFERANAEPDPEKRKALLTFIVIGGGPTGVELAGAIGEIAHHTLAHEYDNIDPRQAKILLLEGLPRILPMFSENLSARATDALKKFGVETRTNSLVTMIDAEGVDIGEERIKSTTVFWAAGVQVSALTRQLAGIATLDRAGRVPIERELHIAGHPEIFVIGDAGSVKTAEGKPLPGIAPVAIQGGRWAAANITRRVKGEAYLPFNYSDKGSMATIGRNHAIAEIKGKQFGGFPAWLMWEMVHGASLPGIRNRLMVFTQWIMNYFTYSRQARLIIGETDAERGKVSK